MSRLVQCCRTGALSCTTARAPLLDMASGRGHPVVGERGQASLLLLGAMPALGPARWCCSRSGMRWGAGTHQRGAGLAAVSAAQVTVLAD